MFKSSPKTPKTHKRHKLGREIVRKSTIAFTANAAGMAGLVAGLAVAAKCLGGTSKETNTDATPAPEATEA